MLTPPVSPVGMSRGAPASHHFSYHNSGSSLVTPHHSYSYLGLFLFCLSQDK